MELYTALNENGSRMNSFHSGFKIMKILTVGDSNSLGLKPNILNEELFKEQLDALVPNVNYDGIMFLDIEDAYGEDLLNLPADNPDFQLALEQFLRCIRYAKSLRPNVNWGYYGIPFTTYWDRTPDFYAKHEKISKLLQECDVLFPSLYSFYKDDEQTYLYEENKKYVEENCVEMIKLGIEYNKSVIPFIWHRYHNSNVTFGLEKIVDDIFLTHVERIKYSEYMGEEIEGVVWWGADDYFFSVGEPALLKEFTGTPAEYSVYNDTVLYNLAIKVLNFL